MSPLLLKGFDVLQIVLYILILVLIALVVRALINKLAWRIEHNEVLLRKGLGGDRYFVDKTVFRLPFVQKFVSMPRYLSCSEDSTHGPMEIKYGGRGPVSKDRYVIKLVVRLYFQVINRQNEINKYGRTCLTPHPCGGDTETNKGYDRVGGVVGQIVLGLAATMTAASITDDNGEPFLDECIKLANQTLEKNYGIAITGHGVKICDISGSADPKIIMLPYDFLADDGTYTIN
jgi:hypothetical protein